MDFDGGQYNSNLSSHNNEQRMGDMPDRPQYNKRACSVASEASFDVELKEDVEFRDDPEGTGSGKIVDDGSGELDNSEAQLD